jgi:hypothetical protein
MMHASLLNRRLSSHRALQARHTSSQAKHGRPLLRRAGYMYSAIPTKWNERHLRVHVCRSHPIEIQHKNKESQAIGRHARMIELQLASTSRDSWLRANCV